MKWLELAWFGLLTTVAFTPAAAIADGASDLRAAREERQELDREIREKNERIAENRELIGKIQSGALDHDSAFPRFRANCDTNCTRGSCTRSVFVGLGLLEASAPAAAPGEGSESVRSSAVSARGLSSGDIEGLSEPACLAIYNARPTLDGIPTGCAAAVRRCGDVAKSLEVSRLENENRGLESEIRRLRAERSELARSASGNDCPECRMIEAARPRDPGVGDYILGGIQALTPMGLGVMGMVTQGNALEAYGQSYNGYLGQCVQVGVPCMPPAFMGGGGFGMGGFGMGGGMGGLAMLGMGGMGMGGLGVGGGFGLNLGLGGSLGMGSPFGGPGMGMGMMAMGLPGMGMGMGMMNPLAMGSLGVGLGYNPYGAMLSGGLGLNLGLGLNAGGGFNPYGMMGPGLGMNLGLGLGVGANPYMMSPGMMNPYSMQMQGQMMMYQQQMQAQMQAYQYQQQMQAYQYQQQVQYQAAMQYQQQMQVQAMRQAQMQQDLMIVQQQMMEAQMRYQQIIMSGGAYSLTGGAGLNFGLGFGAGASLGGWGSMGAGSMGMMGPMGSMGMMGAGSMGMMGPMGVGGRSF